MMPFPKQLTLLMALLLSREYGYASTLDICIEQLTIGTLVLWARDSRKSCRPSQT